VIQLAVAAVHVQRDNPAGALAILDRVEERLSRYPDTHRGVDVVGARRQARQLGAAIDRGATHPMPSFPATPDGAWFTPDPAALDRPTTPTPIPDEPVWLAAGQRRQARQRP
jgi:hypothetical protein